MEIPDPLDNPLFRSPGLFESLGELVFGRRRALNYVQVEVSSVCSAHCVYCPRGIHAGNRKAQYMEAATFAALWPLLRRSERVHLQGWGEPFLHPRFFDFAAFAHKAGCTVSSTSCGSRMNAETARAVVHSGMDVLAFSLAGTDTQSNNVRIGASFEKVCESTELVRRAKAETGVSQPELRCAYLLLADRMEAADALPELAAKLGLEAVVVSTLDYVAAPGQETLAFAPHEEDKIARARELLERIAARAEALGVGFHYALPGREALPLCREEAERGVYVDADGALSPCVYTNVPTLEADAARRVFGNARDGDEWACRTGKQFAAFYAALRSGAPETPCISCPKRFEAR